MGLSINLKKSSLSEIGVNELEIQRVVSRIGCRAGDKVFYYLSVPINVSMNRLDHWEKLVQKFNTKLSTWKKSLVSFGGRWTLLKSVLSGLLVYYFFIFHASRGILRALERVRMNFFRGWGWEWEWLQSGMG